MVATRQGVEVASAPEAFEQFYRRERGGLFRALTLTIGDADLAAEAVDEGMTRALERWRRVRRYDNPAGWVYRVALNWSISRIRRHGRTVPVAEFRDGVTLDPPLPDERLAGVIAGLPAPQRAVVVLRFHLDWSIDGIASALGVPSGTVKSRLHRALARIRDEMEGAR